MVPVTAFHVEAGESHFPCDVAVVHTHADPFRDLFEGLGIGHARVSLEESVERSPEGFEAIAAGEKRPRPWRLRVSSRRIAEPDGDRLVETAVRPKVEPCEKCGGSSGRVVLLGASLGVITVIVIEQLIARRTNAGDSDRLLARARASGVRFMRSSVRPRYQWSRGSSGRVAIA